MSGIEIPPCPFCKQSPDVYEAAGGTAVSCDRCDIEMHMTDWMRGTAQASAASTLLAALDARGNTARVVLVGACFGAVAAKLCPDPDAAPVAMARAMLTAIIDPADPALDWLRAKRATPQTDHSADTGKMIPAPQADIRVLAHEIRACVSDANLSQGIRLDIIDKIAARILSALSVEAQ